MRDRRMHMKDYKTKVNNKIVDYKDDAIEALINLKVEIDMGDLTDEIKNEKINLFNNIAKDVGVLPY